MRWSLICSCDYIYLKFKCTLKMYVHIYAYLQDLDNNQMLKQENTIMPDKIKSRVLDIYNRYKNDIARSVNPGAVESLPTAANLSVIVSLD